MRLALAEPDPDDVDQAIRNEMTSCVRLALAEPDPDDVDLTIGIENGTLTGKS